MSKASWPVKRGSPLTIDRIEKARAAGWKRGGKLFLLSVTTLTDKDRIFPED